MSAQEDPLVYPARPRLFVASEEHAELGDRLLSLAVEESLGGPCRCEATFTNWGPKDGTVDFLWFDRRVLDFGKALRVEAGAGAGEGTIFEGRVMALEGRYLRERPHELLVLAEDRLQDLRMTRRTRTFEQVSDAEVVREVAAQHGLRCEVDVTGPVHRVLAQVNQSDLAFLRERARGADAELWVSGDRLHLHPRGGGGQAVVLTLGRGLLECAVMADLAGQVTAFTVSGWDVAAKDAIRHRATDAVLAGELGGRMGGSRALQEALGAREQQVVHEAPFTTAEAQALAEAHFRRTGRRFVRGGAAAEGDARIRVGATVELRGLGDLFEGSYHVTRARHRFDPSLGLRTEFSFERPGIGP